MVNYKKIKNRTGYNVPDAYFDNFKVSSQPIKHIQQKTGFSLPEAYFEDFKIKLNNKPKVIKLKEFYKTVAVAASLLVILGTLLVGLISKYNHEPSLNFSKLDKSAIENYLEYEMMMDEVIDVEQKKVNFDFNSKLKTNNSIIENLDDTTLEHLMDY